MDSRDLEPVATVGDPPGDEDDGNRRAQSPPERQQEIRQQTQKHKDHPEDFSLHRKIVLTLVVDKLGRSRSSTDSPALTPMAAGLLAGCPTLRGFRRVGTRYLICTNSFAPGAAGIAGAGLCGSRHESKIET